MVQGQSIQIPTVPFDEMVGGVMDELREGVREMIRSLPESIRRAVDLERALKLERKLAWQVFRLSRDNSLSDVANVPSLASAIRVCEAAKARGVADSILERLMAAFEQFENFAIEQCGDRAGLVSMVSGLTHGQSEGVELRVRKTLFRANAHVWGLQADAQVRTCIYEPSPEGEPLRATLVSGSLGIQSMRRNEPLTICSWFTSVPKNLLDGKADASANAQTGEPQPQFELLREFCSSNLPQVKHVAGSDVAGSGVVETEMLIPAAGRSGATTIYLTQTSHTGENARDVGIGAGMFMSVPTSEVVSELLVPAGYTSPATARIAIYGRRHHPELVFEKRDIDLLPQRENVAYLGRLTSSPALDSAPRHHEVVRHVLNRIGLLGRQFDVYRCRIQYPQMHTLAMMRVDGVNAR